MNAVYKILLQNLCTLNIIVSYGAHGEFLKRRKYKVMDELTLNSQEKEIISLLRQRPDRITLAKEILRYLQRLRAETSEVPEEP